MSRTPEGTEPDGQREEESAEQTKGKHQLPLSALSAFSYIPPGRRDPPEHSYFHQEFKTGIVSTYDSIFKRPMGYNEKLHRCDREHANSRGLNINDESLLVAVTQEGNNAAPIYIYSQFTFTRNWQDPVLFCPLQNMGDT
ncbi:cilia- and flagella-associated protein 90 isoform X2 [Chelonoidis abingdonii]|uniref:cilia- and flagella-associated protein 90 isoform X2 n=1 Tax=Chelonoidis abingdonii TaxID=106734 RepID=UPI003F490A59